MSRNIPFSGVAPEANRSRLPLQSPSTHASRSGTLLGEGVDQNESICIGTRRNAPAREVASPVLGPQPAQAPVVVFSCVKQLPAQPYVSL
ncbi:MAG: hypothetical protein FJ096_08345 [Deltaproteobacteria bacterium]|nr:hypothetical protein [Deltaproteobacteria bacterium]